MVILLHVLSALSSMIFTAYVFLRPSQAKLRVSYVLIAATLTSGFYLVGTMKAHLLETCTMGLIYLGVVSFGNLTARNKLATATSNIKDR